MAKETLDIPLGDNHDAAVEKFIATLAEILKEAKGFMFTGVVNRDEGPIVLHSAGGKLSNSLLKKLCVETLAYSKRVANFSAKCDCPDCRAARASQTTH